MNKAVIFLAEGFEEAEAVDTIDVLRRGKIKTTAVSISEEHKVKGAHGITLIADALFSETDFSDVDALILPGGMPGASHLNTCEPLKQLLVKHYEERKLIAAICAAPIVLGGLGLLKGRRATCYPGFGHQLIGATLSDDPVVADGNIITGRGPGLVFDFALAILSHMQTKLWADDVANELLILKLF
ncbi:MAG: DJ-1/PfpI family protein [Tannerellaceae bacterium]|jgi:4-methyl-5(b-hydroxyethyl)-thiazole monophosphate biosynthesis|nr:DJ-1/PfpI family protein [Tannerellaceae bacterium]